MGQIEGIPNRMELDECADGDEKEVVEQIYRLSVQVCLQGLEISVLKPPGSTAGLLHPEETSSLNSQRSSVSLHPEVCLPS